MADELSGARGSIRRGLVASTEADPPLQLFPPLRDAEYQALKADVAERGILVPVEIDADTGQVLDGHHRLAIAEELGLKAPTVKRRFRNDGERTAHIIALNLMRRQMDAATWGRMFQKYRACGESPQSIRKAAKTLGVPEKTARERVKTAQTVDAYPFMEGWKEYRVLEAREHLEALPKDTRETMAEMLSEPFVPPKDAIKLLSNVRQMPRKEQREIADLYDSKDKRDRSLAMTKAAQLPPEPDLRLVNLMQIARDLKACLNFAPDDPLADRFRALMTECKSLQKAIEGQQEERRNGRRK